MKLEENVKVIHPLVLKMGKIKAYWKILVTWSKLHRCSCPLSCPFLAQSGPIWL